MLVTSSLWACNTLTGADNLTVETAGAEGTAASAGVGAGDSGGDSGNGGSSGDDDGNGGGSSGGSGGGGGSGGSGSGSNTACSSTTGTHEECRTCCRSERRGIDEPLAPNVVAAIEKCVCDKVPDCSGLSSDCAACCEGICAGRDSNDGTFSGKCTLCVSGLSCSGLSNVCNQQPQACTALFGCFHDCQDID